jgi:antitoxin VapB
MALSIKDPETDALVRRLARARGVSFTTAIKLAVNNELAKEAAPKKDPEKMLAAVRKLQAEVAASGGFPSMKELDDWMYDENGLPH